MVSAYAYDPGGEYESFGAFAGPLVSGTGTVSNPFVWAGGYSIEILGFKGSAVPPLGLKCAPNPDPMVPMQLCVTATLVNPTGYFDSSGHLIVSSALVGTTDPAFLQSYGYAADGPGQFTGTYSTDFTLRIDPTNPNAIGNGYYGTQYFSLNPADASPVPEPATVTLVIAGLVASATRLRRRKQPH